MSVREDDNKNKKNSSSGLGLAIGAVAVGAGIGAALYYFFNGNENAHGEGSSRNCAHQQADVFRDRSYTLEECSICCELLLAGPRLTSLPCAHRFHHACIQPWLDAHKTCPNCRKAA